MFNLILIPLAANKPSVSSVISRCKTNCANISTSQAKNLGNDEIHISGCGILKQGMTQKLSETPTQSQTCIKKWYHAEQPNTQQLFNWGWLLKRGVREVDYLVFQNSACNIE